MRDEGGVAWGFSSGDAKCSGSIYTYLEGRAIKRYFQMECREEGKRGVRVSPKCVDTAAFC